MCVYVHVCIFPSVSFLWVQVPGAGPKAKRAGGERHRHCSDREGGGGGSVILKGPAENERKRKLWGEN